MILEHLHFCLANHACVSDLLRGQPHLLECYYQNCPTGTHMCVLVSSLVSAWTGGGGGQPNIDRPGQGDGGSQKFPNLCRHPLWMTPHSISLDGLALLN